MNIFYLDPNPEICARYHCDKHVIKMIVESAQILSTVHHILDSAYKPAYKPTHKNHPCVKWAAKSLFNYDFVSKLGLKLCAEYEYRYSRIHASAHILFGLYENVPQSIPIGEFTPPPQCMPEQYRLENLLSLYGNTITETVTAYRNYYIGEKSSFAKWTIREEPEWFTIGMRAAKSS